MFSADRKGMRVVGQRRDRTRAAGLSALRQASAVIVARRFGWPAFFGRALLLLVGWAVAGGTLRFGWADENQVVPSDGVVAPSGTAASGSAVPAEDWVQKLVQRTADSVVTITVEGRDGRQDGMGTGFVLRADGLIATNLHVIGEARPITVRFRSGKAFPVTEVFATDTRYDLAIVRIDAEQLRALPIATAAVADGTPIVALGNPMGWKHSVVSGVVSGTREIEGRQMLQIAIPIEPGNSGGPVLSAQGEVLGLVTLKSAVTANLGFAEPAVALQNLLERPNPILMTRWETIGSLDAREWTPVFGARWRSRAGQMVVSESGDSFGGRALCLATTPPPEPVYELGAAVLLDDESGAAGIVFGADGGDQHYGFYPSAGRLRLTRFAGPTVYSWQILAEFSSVHYRPGEWNHLKVRVAQDRLTCFVNDQSVLEWPLMEPLRGKVGLAKFRDTAARFRQFAVAAELAPSQIAAARTAPLRQTLAADSLASLATAEGLRPFIDDAEAGRWVLQQRAKELNKMAADLQRLADDVHTQATVAELVKCLAAAQPEQRMTRAALLIARLDNPELDVDAYLRQIEQMADELRASVADPDDPAARIERLNRYLFAENGYHGSRTQYYQAANSYLDRVLEDREGLPITLGVLYVELGRRLGLDLEGIGLPGHFVVRFHPPGQDPRYIDVFARGTSMSLDEVRQFVAGLQDEPLDTSFLTPMEDRAIALRMLRNLEGIAQRSRDSESLLRYLEAMVAIAPDEPSFRGMRAVIRQETARHQAAMDDLDWFLIHQPPGVDLEAIRALRQRFAESVEPTADR